MANDTFYTAIDVGTTKVCTIIARVGPDGTLKVAGVGIVPSQGVQKAMVENIDEAREAVKASLDEAQRYLGRKVSWAYVAVSGKHISCMNVSSEANESDGNSSLSKGQVGHLLDGTYPRRPAGKEIVHIIPRTYMVDDLGGVRNPVGLSADKVRVESHVVLAEAQPLKNTIRAVESCGVSVRCLVFQPLAGGEACLSEDEKEIGVVLVDIGGGATGIAVYRNGAPWHSAVLPIGGNNITKDISVGLGVPMQFAEEAKCKMGYAIPDAVPEQEMVTLPTFQGRKGQDISRRTLCVPISARLVETIKLVAGKMDQAGLRVIPPGGLVFTGGSASISGLADLAKALTGAPARVARPMNIPGLPTELRKPAYSASVGTLLWGIKHHGEGRGYSNGNTTSWAQRWMSLLRKPSEVKAAM